MNATARKAGAVAVRDWGGSGVPLLLAHGMAAHSGWWEPVAARWGGAVRAAALDFRGHGDSDWTPDGAYARETWIDDIETARRALGFDRFVLAGHSMGARIALQYAARHPSNLLGVAALDFLPELPPDRPSRFQRAKGRPQPVYPDAETAAGRFRLEPPGTALDAEALRVLGRTGVKPVDGGWTWKFDWRALSIDLEPIWPQLASVPVPAFVARGALSTLMSRADLDRVAAGLPRATAAEIPGAWHHVTLDAPEATAKALADWAGSLRP